MSRDLSDILQRLGECFPKGYINLNNEFIAHRQANRTYGSAFFSLCSCASPEDVICSAIEFLSYDCCQSRPFKTAEANVDFRQYMVDGMNRFLQTALREIDFRIIYIQLGNCVDRNLTKEFIASGYCIRLLQNRRVERVVSADKLLKTINGLEYRARTLEQTRGGNDVLRKLVPKLIEDASTVRIMTVIHCFECRSWTGKVDAESEFGHCSRYDHEKNRSGYCDLGRKKAEKGEGE